MNINAVARGACVVLRSQADKDSPEKVLWLKIIERAVMDLGEPDIRPDENDTPSENYFSSKEFETHAYRCGLEPEYVLDVLERRGLLKDGKRVSQYETFVGATNNDTVDPNEITAFLNE